jgi:hypothetical protein
MTDSPEDVAEAPPSPAPSEAAPTALAGNPLCGIVMPISDWDGCTKTHWAEVLASIVEAVEMTGFEPRLVSDADEVGVIQKRIVQNLAQNPILVCDISGLNPNVMLELGIRLTFDKATVIVKDHVTTSPFDTSIIEYLPYPRDLHYPSIVAFKQLLATKVKATHDRAISDPQYSTFLKQFGQFTVPTIEAKEGTKADIVLDEMREIKRLLAKRDEPVHVSPPTVPVKPINRDVNLNVARDFVKLLLPTRAQKGLATSGDSVEREIAATVGNLHRLGNLSDQEMEFVVRSPMREYGSQRSGI